MSSLRNFPTPPRSGAVTVLERHGELVTINEATLHSGTGTVIGQLIPDLDIPKELLRSCVSRESARSAFLPHASEDQKAKLIHIWYEHGLVGILEFLTNSGKRTGNDSGLLSRCAGACLWIVRMASSLHSSRFPHLALSNEDLVAEFSTNAFWKEGSVRCFSWHPHVDKFALALQNDCITVHTVHHASPSNGYLSNSDNNVVPKLRHQLQTGVADLAWKPMSASVLAVACQSCILVWTLDPMSLSSRPSTSAAQVLTHPGHSPVVSVQWSPHQSNVLVSCSSTDNSIIVWDVCMGGKQRIKNAGRGGVTLIRWSPDGANLLTACPSTLFVVWQCVTWTKESWTKLQGRIKDACWSSDGRTLLFSTANDHRIYSVEFELNRTDGVSVSTSRAATSAIDVSLTTRDLVDGSTISVGGQVQCMAWDEHSERLAVVFQGQAAAFVALYQTRTKPRFEAIPCGFIRGQSQELATIVSFKPNFTDGAILSVVWSSGRLSHIPLIYSQRGATGTHVGGGGQLLNSALPGDLSIQRFSTF